MFMYNSMKSDHVKVSNLGISFSYDGCQVFSKENLEYCYAHCIVENKSELHCG